MHKGRLLLLAAAVLLAACIQPANETSGATAPPPADDDGGEPPPTQRPGGCPGHWHSTMKVFVHGAEVSFGNYSLEDGNTPVSAHLHRNDVKHKWHWEPPQGRRCIPFAQAAAHVGMDLSPGRLVLWGEHAGRDGTYTEDGAVRLRAFSRLPDAEWAPFPVAQLDEAQLADGERLLILFGDHGDDEVAAFQALVPDPYATAR